MSQEKRAPLAPVTEFGERARYLAVYQSSFQHGPTIERFADLASLTMWLRIVLNVSAAASQGTVWTGPVQTLQRFGGRWVAL